MISGVGCTWEGEHRNLAKSIEMISGVGCTGNGEYRKLAKSSETISGMGRCRGRGSIKIWRNLANDFGGWGFGEEG